MEPIPVSSRPSYGRRVASGSAARHPVASRARSRVAPAPAPPAVAGRSGGSPGGSRPCPSGSTECRGRAVHRRFSLASGRCSPCSIVEIRAHRIVAEVVAANDLDASTRQDVSDDHVVRVDRGQLAQMLSNLLTNAAKYGAPRIEITSHADRHDGTITLRVRDHGSGVHAVPGAAVRAFHSAQHRRPSYSQGRRPRPVDRARARTSQRR